MSLARLVLAAACLGFACQSPPPGAPPPARAAPAPFAPPTGFTRLRVSLTPHLSPEHLERSHQPLSEYLSGALGVPVEVAAAESYDGVGELLKEGEVDLAELSPFAYVRAQKAGTPMRPLVTVISDGSATAAGYLVVRAESPYRSLEDLRGGSFAFVDRASTSGYLFPRKLMAAQGIDPRTFFARTAFLGNHEAALLAVHEGRFDAGATYQGALPALQRSRGVDPLSFRVIAKTPRTPRDIFCVRAGLDEAVAAEIQRALLAISVRTAEGRRVLRPMNINGFIPADERPFDLVREVDAVLADDSAP